MAYLKINMHIKSLILKKKVLSLLERKFPILGKQCNPRNAIRKFLETEFHGIAEAYTNGQTTIHDTKDFHPDKNTIWIFWWQGYDKAPPLVQKCIDSVRAHANGNTLVIISEENYNDYADFPSYIIKKVKERKISITHFSDILRMVLITTHGGLWLDATIFVSQDVPEECFSLPYFTIRYLSSSSKISKGRWTGFCQSGQQDCAVQKFCLDVFLAYWKKFDILIDYFLIDYVTLWGYERVPAIREMIDAVPPNNEGVKELEKHFNDLYSEQAAKQILASAVFFKLNWKRNYKTEIDGKQTLYGAFLADAVR